jgi:hypothetical protein
MRPQENEFAPFYMSYIGQVPQTEPIPALEKAAEEIPRFLSLLSEAKGDYRYAPDKWSVKELLQHAIDTERIMAYRALTIARGDTTPLPGFDENSYARIAHTDYRTISDLKSEFQVVRKSTLCLFQNFDESAFRRRGIANDNPITVLALAYIIAGHQLHHFKILRERYFPELVVAKP